MKLLQLIIFCLSITTKIFGQVVYDTIPEEIQQIGNFTVEELVIFKDFDLEIEKSISLYESYLINDTSRLKVFVSAVFGANGKIQNCRVIRSAGFCLDSICFYAIKNLSNWLPAKTRGQFTNMPFVFMFQFDKNGFWIPRPYNEVFNSKPDEYNLRQELFLKQKNIKYKKHRP
jgi:hypothetical protein